MSNPLIDLDAPLDSVSRDNFKDFFDDFLNNRSVREQSVVKGTVIEIGDEFVTVDIGYKAEGVVRKNEFMVDGRLTINTGDQIDVYLDQMGEEDGMLELSKEKADLMKAWEEISKAVEADQTVKGLITGRVKGGLSVDIGVKAFLPGSQVDLRPVKNLDKLIGETHEFKIIKFNKKRGNIVLSRRVLLEREREDRKQETLKSLRPTAVMIGTIKNITDYGAFVDLGGIDGLLHITDLAWRRVKHPSEVVTVGDEVTAVVLKFDQEKNRVSLGLKQLGEDPWVGLARRYPTGTRMFGKVANLTDYGAFVEIEPGIEGLVHVSEMDWTNKNVNPSKMVSLGDEVEVMVLEIDEDRRRISLGMKQCKANPWDEFAMNFKKGDKVKGQIKSITDFGVFIGLSGGIDGLVHLSDLSWSLPGEEALRNYRKGEEVEAVVLAIDVEKERISLGVKQLENDPFNAYVATHDKGSIVKGAVKSLDAKGAVITLDGDVEGYLRASEVSRERVEDIRNHLKEGDEVEAVIINIDRKNRQINLSIKAKDAAEQSEALRKLASEQSTGTTNLGALLKAKLDNKSAE